jgi:hypothetical protein
MNYAQLRVFDTVTLGWVAGAHPSFSYRDKMKERLSKLMKGEHSNLQYALFPRSFHYITDKNKRLTTRGVAIQIMKSDNISPAKFREIMVQQWQRIEEESGNLRGGGSTLSRPAAERISGPTLCPTYFTSKTSSYAQQK